MEQTTIRLCVQEESRLYNSLDPSWEKISDEVYNYLKSFCVERGKGTAQFDKIQIISDAPIDVNRFREKLHKAVKKDQDAFNWQLKVNNSRAIWEYITGISLSVVGFLLSYFLDKIILAVVSFFGTMLLREAVLIGTKLNPDIKRLRKRLDPLITCDVELISQMSPENSGDAS